MDIAVWLNGSYVLIAYNGNMCHRKKIDRPWHMAKRTSG